MIPWRELGRATVPGEAEPLVLCQRESEFVIRVGRHALMSSRAHGTEEMLAELACARIASRAAPRVLVGGLGMGFTLAAALRTLGPDAHVEVAELVPALVEWNRGPLAPLAGRPLDDPRASVREADVAEAIRERSGAYDAILLDVDNGPNGLTRATNDWLYSPAGLGAAREALRERGVLGVWSVAPDEAFTRRLREAGFDVEERTARARRTKGGQQTLWIAVAGTR
ncbi:MAG TPA: spermidine synthase [Vicinamibacteria bacterium]